MPRSPEALARFRGSELTPRRVIQALVRRVRELPHGLAWSMGADGAGDNRAQLARLHNTHIGQRCFILGNGPSLRSMDLAPLRREVTFGLNRIYLLFEQMGFTPTYFVCINELVLEQFGAEISRLPMPKFLNWNRRGLFERTDPSLAYVRLRLGLRDGFGEDLRRPIFSGGTVTYAALQVAYFMGFHEVILIGVDHAYRERGVPNAVAVRQQPQDADHFHPEYFPKGSRWQPPDLLRSELAYGLARRVYERQGRRILDATVGGRCPVFERTDFTAIVQSGSSRRSVP